jgi:dolichyldiphosphatase
MPCLSFLLAPPPRPCLADSVSRSPLPNKYRFFLPQTRRRPSPRLGDGVRMAEMTRVWSCGEPLEVGVSMESDPIVGGEAPSRSRWEASRWAPVEAALNRMVSVYWQDTVAVGVLDKDSGNHICFDAVLYTSSTVKGSYL